jgi:hypothetical protein
MKFTLAKISEFIEGDLREIKKLNLSGKGIDKLEDLRFFGVTLYIFKLFFIYLLIIKLLY